MVSSPRLAVRGVILIENRLLLVNAWPGGESVLWCAPGGGVELHESLPATLKREVAEETGLEISVGAPCLVNEFNDPCGSFHQVDIYFRTQVTGGALRTDHDPEGVVNRHRLASRAEMADLWIKPDTLAAVAWGEAAADYDPLEPIVR